MNVTEIRRNRLKHLALVLALGVGLGAATARAQAILEVGGAGTIGDTTLTTTAGTAKLSAKGVNWTAKGGDGNTFSSLISPPVAVTTTGAVTLTFTHRYNFEATFDGGVVFVSVNGGSFTKVPLASFTTNGYNDVAVASIWALGDEMFGALSTDWGMPTLITSVANLGTLNATDTIAVEFRGGWDGNTYPASPNWEIGTVTITDTAATLLDVNFTADGTAGFTASTTGTGSSPWGYLQDVSRFEINASTLAADRYTPDIPGSVIDLNGADLQVVRLTGVYSANTVFSLFDLSGGTTLTGTYRSISLPPGTWDTSNLAVNGTITLAAPPPSMINEPFGYSAGNLNGTAAVSTTGVTGNWTATTASPAVTVDSGSLSFGALAISGSKVNVPQNNKVASVNVGSTLNYANLLANGQTLWFSFLYKNTRSASGTNDQSAFALGTVALNPTNLLPLTGGSGIGVSIEKNLEVRPSHWSAATRVMDTNVNLALQATALIVGKIEWGATDLDSEKITIYLPATDLLEPVTGNDFTVPALTQTSFTLATFGTKGDAGNSAIFDEVRFGSSYASVVYSDPNPPTLAASGFVDNKNGGPILEADTVIYNVLFSKVMDPLTIDASDFENGGTTPLTNNSVVISGNLAVVTVTPTFPGAAGTLQLRVKAGADLKDVSATALDTTAAIADDTVITVNADVVAPTVVSIVSPPAATPIFGLPTIPYTVTFNKFYMNDGSVTASDFVNAGTASISVGAVTRTSAPSAPAVYAFNVTTLSAGTVQLQLAGTVSDVMGNSVVTPVDDDTIYTLDAGPEPVKQTVTLDSVLDISLRYVAGSTKTFTFDASGSDKLVVVVTGEHNFGGNTSGNVKTITYDGVSLTKALEINPPSSSLQTTSDLWYMDDPGLVHSAGTIIITVEGNGTNYVQTAFGLSGTAPGFGTTATRIGSSATQLIPSSASSYVISWVTFGGVGNTAGTAETVLANSPVGAVTFGSKRQPNNYTGHALAHTTALTPDTYTFSFNTALTDILGLGVEFLAAEVVGAYSSWAGLNGAGVNLDDNHDNDGVDNGIEYFLGGPSGATTGFTALPGIIDTAGTLSVTWPKGAGYLGVYGIDFVIETSATLSGDWTTETLGGGNVTDTGTEVKFTFPGPLSGKNFARLKVMGP